MTLTHAAVGGICAALTFVGMVFIFYKFVSRHKKKSGKVYSVKDDTAASSVSGNFVKDTTDKIENVYEVTDSLLGRGGSAEVVIGIKKSTRRRYAIKIINISRPEVAWRYEREKNFLRDIDHTNVVRLFEVFHKKKAMFFVMELCTGGHLGQVLRNTPEGYIDPQIARQYILQITRALVHCHARGICHRDIKLQNILLENRTKDAQVKLVDFGNGAHFVGHCPMTKIVGTTYTAAPEVFKESYDERCDIWSLGVVAYILLSGRRPFEGLSIPHQPRSKETSLIASILMGRYHFMHNIWEVVPSAAVHFIQCCLEMDYKNRKSASQLLDHPWLAHQDIHANIGTGLISRQGAKSLNQRLSRNLSCTGLRRTSMMAVAFAMPTQKAQQLRSLFQEIDKDGSGTVEREEFHSVMHVINSSMSESDIDFLFDTIDQDGNQNISFLEFVAATVDPREVDIQELNQAFRLLDKDQKGYITNEDLQRVLVTNQCDDENGDFELLGSKSDQENRMSHLKAKIQEVIAQADVDHDGVVSYTEFLFAMADGSLNIELSNRDEIESKKTISSMPASPVRSKKRRQSDSIIPLSGNAFSRSTRRSSLVKKPLPKNAPIQEEIGSCNESTNLDCPTMVNDSKTEVSSFFQVQLKSVMSVLVDIGESIYTSIPEKMLPLSWRHIPVEKRGKNGKMVDFDHECLEELEAAEIEHQQQLQQSKYVPFSGSGNSAPIPSPVTKNRCVSQDSTHSFLSNGEDEDGVAVSRHHSFHTLGNLSGLSKSTRRAPRDDNEYEIFDTNNPNDSDSDSDSDSDNSSKGHVDSAVQHGSGDKDVSIDKKQNFENLKALLLDSRQQSGISPLASDLDIESGRGTSCPPQSSLSPTSYDSSSNIVKRNFEDETVTNLSGNFGVSSVMNTLRSPHLSSALRAGKVKGDHSISGSQDFSSCSDSDKLTELVSIAKRDDFQLQMQTLYDQARSNGNNDDGSKFDVENPPHAMSGLSNRVNNNNIVDANEDNSSSIGYSDKRSSSLSGQSVDPNPPDSRPRHVEQNSAAMFLHLGKSRSSNRRASVS